MSVKQFTNFLNGEAPIVLILLPKVKTEFEKFATYQKVKVLFDFAEHRNELYYFFGLLCLIGWLAFNLWVLRDYFCPWWFEQIYTETGLPQHKLELKKTEILMRNRVSNAFSITTNIAIPHQIRFDSISEPRHNSLPQTSSSSIRPPHHQQQHQQQTRSHSTVVMGF